MVTLMLDDAYILIHSFREKWTEMKWPAHMALLLFSCLVVSDSFVTPWTVAHHTSLSMGFSRKNIGMGCHLPMSPAFHSIRQPVWEMLRDASFHAAFWPLARFKYWEQPGDPSWLCLGQTSASSLLWLHLAGSDLDSGCLSCDCNIPYLLRGCWPHSSWPKTLMHAPSFLVWPEAGEFNCFGSTMDRLHSLLLKSCQRRFLTQTCKIFICTQFVLLFLFLFILHPCVSIF